MHNTNRGKKKRLVRGQMSTKSTLQCYSTGRRRPLAPLTDADSLGHTGTLASSKCFLVWYSLVLGVCLCAVLRGPTAGRPSLAISVLD